MPLMLVSLLLGCDRDALVAERSFTQDVAAAYAECNEAEIRFLAARNGIQTAFANCGSNDFVHFSWSPDGIHLYFQLPFSAALLDGEKKTIQKLPTEVPVGDVAWLSADLLVMPLAPKQEGGTLRLALWHRTQNTLQELPTPLVEVADVEPTGATDAAWLLGRTTAEGPWRAFRADFTEGRVTEAMPFLQGATRIKVTPEQDAVLWSHDGVVTWSRISTGEEVRTFPAAHRGILHPDGKVVALEITSDPISPFDQKATSQLTEEQRERERRRQQAWLEKQPDWVPRELHPPGFELVDVETGGRWRITSFYGDRFEWYPGPPYYASFVLWGIEGKELNRNIALVDLAERLRYARMGQPPEGMEPRSVSD